MIRRIALVLRPRLAVLLPVALPVLLVAQCAGCRRSPTEGRSPGPPGTASSLPAPGPAGRGTVRYTFSASESKIVFDSTGAKGKRHGALTRFSGVISVVDQEPTRASATVDMDMTSLQADFPELSGLMASSSFLATSRYPHARFVSSSVSLGGDLGATNTVIGTLDLRGVTRKATIPATVHVREDGVDVDAEVTIHLKDLGWPAAQSPSPPVIDDEVLVNIQIYARRAS